MKPAAAEPFGPPLIGALLRIPWEAVQRHMLERLHERGFDEFRIEEMHDLRAVPGSSGHRRRRIKLLRQEDAIRPDQRWP